MEFAYTTGYDSRGRVSVNHIVDERGCSVMLRERDSGGNDLQAAYIAGFVGKPPGKGIHPTSLPLTGNGTARNPHARMPPSAVIRLEWKRRTNPGGQSPAWRRSPRVSLVFEALLSVSAPVIHGFATGAGPIQLQLPVEGLGLNSRLTLAVGAGLGWDAAPPLPLTPPPGTLLSPETSTCSAWATRGGTPGMSGRFPAGARRRRIGPAST